MLLLAKLYWVPSLGQLSCKALYKQSYEVDIIIAIIFSDKKNEA